MIENNCIRIWTRISVGTIAEFILDEVLRAYAMSTKNIVIAVRVQVHHKSILINFVKRYLIVKEHDKVI